MKSEFMFGALMFSADDELEVDDSRQKVLELRWKAPAPVLDKAQQPLNVRPVQRPVQLVHHKEAGQPGGRVDGVDEGKGREAALAAAHQAHLLKLLPRGDAGVVQAGQVALLAVQRQEDGLRVRPPHQRLVDGVNARRDGAQVGGEAALPVAAHVGKLAAQRQHLVFQLAQLGRVGAHLSAQSTSSETVTFFSSSSSAFSSVCRAYFTSGRVRAFFSTSWFCCRWRWWCWCRRSSLLLRGGGNLREQLSNRPIVDLKVGGALKVFRSHVLVLLLLLLGKELRQELRVYGQLNRLHIGRAKELIAGLGAAAHRLPRRHQRVLGVRLSAVGRLQLGGRLLRGSLRQPPPLRRLLGTLAKRLQGGLLRGQGLPGRGHVRLEPRHLQALLLRLILPELQRRVDGRSGGWCSAGSSFFSCPFFPFRRRGKDHLREQGLPPPVQPLQRLHRFAHSLPVAVEGGLKLGQIRLALKAATSFKLGKEGAKDLVNGRPAHLRQGRLLLLKLSSSRRKLFLLRRNLLLLQRHQLRLLPGEPGLQVLQVRSLDVQLGALPDHLRRQRLQRRGRLRQRLLRLRQLALLPRHPLLLRLEGLVVKGVHQAMGSKAAANAASASKVGDNLHRVVVERAAAGGDGPALPQLVHHGTGRLPIGRHHRIAHRHKKGPVGVGHAPAGRRMRS
ncbi:hypothetical protein TYRP_000759 [Tyrophagus putrescentiae]|nr:hypothetical protein TYRP_000759 [Tyrophagus putrescentiae]